MHSARFTRQRRRSTGSPGNRGIVVSVGCSQGWASSRQTTGYVRIERRKLESLLVKQFKASLSELSDEELAVLFEDVILSKRITAADMLQPASRNSENSTSSNSSSISDVSPPRSSSADRNTSARQQEPETDTAQQQSQSSKPSSPWAASLGFRPDNSQAPDVVDTNPVSQEKKVPPAAQKDTFTVPWSRQSAITSPDTASPSQGKGTTELQGTSTVKSQQNSSGGSIDKKTQESDIAQAENEEGVDPTLQLLQQLMSQSTQNEKKQSVSPMDTSQSADKDTGRNTEDDSWFSNPLSSVLEQLPSAPQLPSLPELPNVGEALSSLGTASQQVLAGAAAVTGAVSETVSEGLELNGRAQAALGLGGIAITVATIALLIEAKQQPEDPSVSSSTLGSQAQATDSSTDDESNPNTTSQPLKEAVAGASTTDASNRAGSTSGSDTEQKSRESTPSKRPVSPTGRRGAFDMQKLLDNGPVLSPPPPPVLPSSVMNGGLPIDPTYNPQGNTISSTNGNSSGGILWQRQATTNNQPPLRRAPLNALSPQWDNGSVSNGRVENTSMEQNRAQAGWNSNSNVEPAIGNYQVPSDPWDPEAVQQDSNGLPAKQQQQTVQAGSSWPVQEPRTATAGVNMDELQNARASSQLPSPWDS